jgi:wyosine [tRNA(Phe)-imidazoG37] synthetase (radical SAM superfamily)
MQQNGPTPDVLTFAGNGEPTAHPRFPEIIEDTLALRDKYFPNAKVSVLSNSTFIHRQVSRLKYIQGLRRSWKQSHINEWKNKYFHELGPQQLVYSV